MFLFIPLHQSEMFLFIPLHQSENVSIYASTPICLWKYNKLDPTLGSTGLQMMIKTLKHWSKQVEHIYIKCQVKIKKNYFKKEPFFRTENANFSKIFFKNR